MRKQSESDVNLDIRRISAIYQGKLVESQGPTKNTVKESSIEQPARPVIIETNDLMRVRYPSKPGYSMPLGRTILHCCIPTRTLLPTN